LLIFFTNSLSLSQNFEIEQYRGARYRDLSVEFQKDFLSYPLSIDFFTDISQEEIYEVFRRMNSNAQTLTPEEIRHAQFQGKFKWFIYRRGREFERLLTELKTFGPRQFIKMLDLRWLAELLDSFENGIRTTKGSDLKKIYSDNDNAYPRQIVHKKYLDEIRASLPKLKPLQGYAVLRPHMLASIALAVIHLRHKVPALANVVAVKKAAAVKLDKHIDDLRVLNQAIDQKDVEGPLGKVVAASIEGTNVKKAREIRFKYFCELFS
jgi:hypothetical protein